MAALRRTSGHEQVSLWLRFDKPNTYWVSIVISQWCGYFVFCWSLLLQSAMLHCHSRCGVVSSLCLSCCCQDLNTIHCNERFLAGLMARAWTGNLQQISTAAEADECSKQNGVFISSWLSSLIYNSICLRMEPKQFESISPLVIECLE